MFVRFFPQRSAKVARKVWEIKHPKLAAVKKATKKAAGKR